MKAGSSSSPPLLLLAAAPRSGPLTDGLAAAVKGAILLPDLAAAKAALLAKPAAILILACPRPEIGVAELLAQGRPPSLAVADWAADLRSMMALLRAYRRRTKLVFDDAGSGAADLARLLELKVKVAAPGMAPKPDSVLLVIARDALLRNAAAHAIAKELEASAVLPPHVKPGLDLKPDAIFTAYRESRPRPEQSLPIQGPETADPGEEITPMTAREASLIAECALLRKQLGLEVDTNTATSALNFALERDLSQMTVERDHEIMRAVSAHQDGQRVVAQLRQQLFNLGQQLELHYARGEEYQVERQALLAEIRELHAIRAELETYFDHAERLQEQVSALSTRAGRLEGELQAGQSALSERTAHAEWLAAEIQRIYKSRSYRLLSPLRKLRKRSTPTAENRP